MMNANPGTRKHRLSTIKSDLISEDSSAAPYNTFQELDGRRRVSSSFDMLADPIRYHEHV